MKRLALCCIILLSACSDDPYLPLNEEVSVTMNAKQDHLFGYETSVIRSYKTDESGKQVEFAGAVCSGKNAWFSFRGLTTPALVKLPLFLQADRFQNRGKPPVLTVQCRSEGKTVELGLAPTNAVGNTVVQGSGYYDATTGTYSQPTSTQLTSRLTTTLPWHYPSLLAEF